MSILKTIYLQHLNGANPNMTLGANGEVVMGTSSSNASVEITGRSPKLWISETGTADIVELFLKQTNTDGEGLKLTYDSATGHSYINSVFSGGDIIFQTASSIRMRIDSSGRVTTPSQPHIRGGISRSTQSAGVGNLFYQRSAIGLSFSTDRITVPVAGVYMITWMTIAETNIGRYDANLLVNGSTICSALNEANGDGYHQKTLSISANLSASDYIQFYNQRWYSINSDPGEWSQLSVTLLG